APAHLRVGIEEETVAEDRDRLRLHVVGEDVGPATYRGVRLSRAIERKGRSRTRAEVDAVDPAGASNDLYRVAAHRFADAHGAHLTAERRDLGWAEDRLPGVRPTGWPARGA